MQYWLMKSEPDVYGIEDLQRDRQTLWDGIRNYQARNFLKCMEPGDLVFFYHSNATPPGIAGLMRVVEPGVVDPTQFDPQSKYYDSKSAPDNPRWHTVTVEFVEALPDLFSLDQLREHFTENDLLILRRGTRLSVTPVDEAVVETLLRVAGFQHRPAAIR